MDSDAANEAVRDAIRKAAGAAGELSLRDAERIATEACLLLRHIERAALEEGIVPRRYARNVPSLGADGQRRLLGCCAGVMGLGGLGGCAVECLARLGVGRIVGVDPDAIAESNLNRQLLATTESVGLSKADQARLRVARINPAVEFAAHAVDFRQLPEGTLAGCDVILDCLDSIPARRELARRSAAAGVVLVHAAIAGWCGQLAVCPPGSDLLEKLYAGGKRGIEGRLGNLPFTAAVAANWMAARAAALLLGRIEPREELVFFDLLAGEWETVEP